MKHIFFLFIVIVFSGDLLAQSADEAAIRSVLASQETAWNRGDLSAFMVGYWENDSMMFVGKSGVTYGYQQTLDRYVKGYSDTAHMGHFTSTVLHVNKISRDAYFVVGKWYLKRSVGDANGMYTLLFRRVKGQWVIVVDHSS